MGRTVDLNCDLGEGCANDAELMPLITSANICCGHHAGNLRESQTTLQLAAQHGVVAGAHPGFADREHFGRRELPLGAQQIYDDCLVQVDALRQLASECSWPLRHLKPHGALYNMACREESYARPIVEAAAHFGLALVGLPNSQLEKCSAGRCRFIAEGFADRRYMDDSSLVPRGQANAMIEDPAEAALQVERLLNSTNVQTICIHGDNPMALPFLHDLRMALEKRDIVVAALNYSAPHS
jgi:UPF0271 protein